MFTVDLFVLRCGSGQFNTDNHSLHQTQQTMANPRLLKTDKDLD